MRGFAAKCEGQIDMKTVSATERAAKVNTNGIRVLNSHTDTEIDVMFSTMAPGCMTTIVAVEVSELQ